MRDGKEVRRAIAMLGVTFLSELRDYIWGPEMDLERTRAWAMFEALGWAAGADDSDFTVTLEYAESKILEYARKEATKHYATN